MSTITASPAVAAGANSRAGKKKRALTIGGIVAAILAAWFAYEHFFYISTDNAQVQANTVILTSRVTGYVHKVHVQEGQKVKAGQVLIEIEAKDYKSRTSQSENELASVAARARDARLNHERIEKLFQAGAVSAQQRDSARATYQELANKQQALEAQVELSQSGLSDTQLRAPTDGIIARKSAEVGMLANPGTPLVGFVSSESRWVVANFKETDLGRLKVGQPVTIEVDAIPGRDFHGVVQSFQPATGAVFSLLPPDNATGNFTKVVQRVPTRIELRDLTADDIDLLKAGLSADVHVKLH